MPDGTPFDGLSPQDLAFLASIAPAEPPEGLVLGASPETMQVGVALIVTALLEAQFPHLTAEQRALLAGQLTSDHRDLLLAIVELLTDYPDIAREAQTGPEVFDAILKMDVATEGFGETCGRLVQSLAAGEIKQNEVLRVLGGRVLLAAGDALAALDPLKDRDAYEGLFGSFGPAFNQQAEMYGGKAAPANGDPQTLPRTLDALRAELASIEQDQTVAQNVSAILSAAKILEEQGQTFLLAGK